ncbi:MAG: ABC transporter ATP-binding protein [Dermatophilaceae bacterium]
MPLRPSPPADATPADTVGGVLKGHGLTKQVNGAWLLRPTDIEVSRGECVVLRGPNGSGKTTLLRILAGMMTPSEGTVTINGRPVDERDRATRDAVAALVGAPTAYRDLTLGDHLVLIDATWGRDPQTCADRVLEQLDALEISHLATRFPHELSSGQQQLFHLALVLIRPARVLLLDEPEQRLDTHKRNLLTELLTARAESGTALVVACHDPDMTEALGDYVLDFEPW